MCEFLGQAPPAEAIPIEQILVRCLNCTLEYADPLIEPPREFYEWLTLAGLNYPRRRWEWEECIRYLSRRFGDCERPLRLLDLGAGDGGFLRHADNVPWLNACGIEQSREAVAECGRQGLRVKLATLESLCVESVGQFDAVTLWHVVEHVSNPVAVLEAASRVLSPRGSIFFSVPITPMCTEHSCPDPFNEPPHHLTRWNMRSLQALASRLRMTMETILPSADSVAIRTIRTLVLRSRRSAGPRTRASKLRDLSSFCVRHPCAIVEEFARQRKHPRNLGRPLPDLALIIVAR